MKKVLSFVLVLALVLGSFSMAFAANLSDIAGDDNYEAINVVASLGIIEGYPDGTFAPDKDVTRAEFAAMITRALAIPASALAGYTATEFNDVAGYTWAVPYLAFCDAKGIILGDGNGNVMPGRTINVNEAMTMVLRAVGYVDNSAYLVGNWPSNYVTLAQDKGLYDDVAAVATVDRASAAQIIYNALTLTKVQVDADGATATIGASMLTSGLGCVAGAAQVIDGTEATLIDLADYEGAYVKTFLKGGKIVAIDSVKSTYITGTYSSASGIFKTADKVEYKLASTTALTTGAVTFANGYATADAAGTAGALMADAKTYTIAAKLDGKKVVELYSVANWTISAHTKINDADLTDIAKNFKLESCNFKKTEDGKAIDTTSFELVGVDSLDKIAKDNIVYVYVGNDVITKIEVATATVTGTVTKIDSNAGTTQYAINGANYKVAAQNASPVIELVEGTANLDINGDIYAWTAKVEKPQNYAVIVATKIANTDTATGWSDEKAATSDCAIKLFTIEGQSITAPMTSVQAVDTNLTAGAVIKYSLDDKGALKLYATNQAVQMTGTLLNNGTLLGTQVIASDVIVVIKDAKATDGWKIGKIADLATKKNITVSAITNSAAKIAVMFVDNSASLATTTPDTNYGIVTKYDVTVKNAKGTVVQSINALINGEAKTDILATGTGITATITTGTVLQEIAINTDGNITGVKNTTAATIGAATVTAIDGNIITFASGAYQLADNAIVYVWDKTAKNWTIGAAADLKDKVATLYNTKADDKSAGYEVVMAY